MMKLIPYYKIINNVFLSQLRSGMEELGLFSPAALYFSAWEFDDEWYLYKYADIADAVSSGDFSSAKDHFFRVGYYEGRHPMDLQIDDDWYMENYPDVAKSMINGSLKSPLEHFREHGYREGRLPGKPEIRTEWYAPRYMPELSVIDPDACLRHYIEVGYLNGALACAP